MNDYIHDIQYCSVCQAYITHIQSLGCPAAWNLLRKQLEILRSQRNEQIEIVKALTYEKCAVEHELDLTKRRLEYYQNECIKLRLGLDSPHSSSTDGDTAAVAALRVSSPALSPPFPPTNRRINARGPRTIGQLEYLMASAHEPGNTRALSKIKVLCAEAHNTPRERKTALQQHLLIHWRNPESADRHPPTFDQLRLKTNPRRDDPVEIWYEYLCTHQASWPCGVRRDSNNCPFLPDLKASRMIAQLKPNEANEPVAMIRYEFMQIVKDIFSKPGFYRALLEKYRLQVSPISNLRPYPLPPPVTIESVTRHFALCGVTVQQVQDQIEPWAHNYKLSRGLETSP